MNAAPLVRWSFVGVILMMAMPLLIVIGLFGGPLLGVALLAGLIVLLPAVSLMAVYRMVWPAAAPMAAPAVAVPVVAKLVRFSGSCATCTTGVRMERLAAREFEFANGKMTTPSMCGPARHLLLPYVAKLRAGEQIHTVSLACPVVAGNELDFEMRPRESIAA